MKFFQSGLAAGCVALALSAANAMAAFSYWDPQGTAGGGPTSGTWETSSWSTSTGGQASPGSFVNANAADFAVGGAGSSSVFTVTMNANHTVGGVWNGFNVGACNVTINGSGTITLSGQQGFNTSGAGTTTINVPIAGAGGQLIPENSGTLVLNGTNTYTGGTQLGFSSSVFTGNLTFNNGGALGTGGILFAFGSSYSLTLSGTSPVTITNGVTNNQTGSINCTINGNSAGLTFSGPWNLAGVANASLPRIASGGASSNVVTISGVISSTNGLTVNGPGMLVLTGANSYGTAGITAGSTTVSSGTLVLANSSGSATGVSGIVVPLSGTLTGNGTASGSVDTAGTISATNMAGGTATLTTGPLTIEVGSVYQWAINNATGTAGAASGWDQITVNGGVNINANPNTLPLAITVMSLNSSNQPGALATFDNTRDYSWRVLHSTSGPITNFSTTNVGVFSGLFSNSMGSAVFTVSTNNAGSGGDMYVNFVHTPSLTLSNLTVGQGSNAVFNAVNTIPSSTAATAVYSWKSNGVPLTDGGRISGSSTPTLTITSVQAGDATTYTVTGANAAGTNSVSATLTVNLSSTVVTWPTPGPIVYGTALTTNQLNATANVPGNFVYTPPLGTVLNAGNNLLSVIFTPTDTNTYRLATNTVNQVVTPASLTVTANTFTRPQGTTNPVFTGNLVGIQNGDNITANYASSATSGSPTGTYPIIPSLVDPNNRATNYNVTLVNGTLFVGTVITWPTPAPITYGTPLSGAQLDATADVPGNFVYSPPVGTVLNTGTYQLSVYFTPNDTGNYQIATGTVNQVVSPAPLTVTANNATRTAGTTNPVFSGTIVGLQNGDNISATYSTVATSASPAGTYPIIPALVDPNNEQANYSVTLVNGSLVISAPPPPISVNAPNIIPLPVTLQTRAGTFTLCPSQPVTPALATATMTILVDAASQQTGQYLANALAKSTGYRFKVAANTATNAVRNAILITTSNALGTLGTEGYELTVAPDSVVIRAPAQGGTFYGVQSLLQLLPPQIYSPRMVTNVPWVAPCVFIQDYPLFSWRGVMLDVARHFANKDEVKQVLDAMAMHKLNTFHWHLVDDQGFRLEITNYPNLTALGAWRNGTDYGLPPRATTATNAAGQYGGYYTQADARDIVAYAAERHITVVPEIEMPAHSDAGLYSYGQFSCGDEGGYTMDYFGIQSIYNIDLYSLGRAGTMDFLREVLTETMAIFPSKYIHCGGDEVIGTGDKQWNSYNADVTNMAALGITPNGNTSIIQYQHWFSTNMSAFIQANGRVMMGWSEYEAGGLVPNAAVMDWQTGTSSMAGLVASNNLPVVMSPDTTCYINYVEGNSANLPIEPPFVVGGVPSYLSLSSIYAFNPIPSGLATQYQSNILGAQCNLWGEYVPSFYNMMFKMWPRETAMSEITWTPRASQSFSGFTNRLVLEKQRYAAMGLNYDHESIPALGTWSNVGTGGTTLTFDITTNVTASGEIDISFWYLTGSPLSISSVALLVNGTQVDIDTHNGTASGYQPGSQPFIPIFTLYIVRLPEFKPGATYTIKATVAGSGGTATSGTVYMPNWD